MAACSSYATLPYLRTAESWLLFKLKFISVRPDCIKTLTIIYYLIPSTVNSRYNEHHWDQDFVSVIEKVCSSGSCFQ